MKKSVPIVILALLLSVSCALRSYHMKGVRILKLTSPQQVRFYADESGCIYYPDTVLVMNKDIYINDAYNGRALHYERGGGGVGRLKTVYGGGMVAAGEVTAYVEQKVLTYVVTNEFGVQTIMWTNTWTNYPSAGARFTEPGKIAVDSQGHVLVENIILPDSPQNDAQVSFIYAFDPSGAFIGRIGVAGMAPLTGASQPQPFTGIADLSFNALDQLYVVCNSSDIWTTYVYNFVTPKYSWSLPTTLNVKDAAAAGINVDSATRTARILSVAPSPHDGKILAACYLYDENDIETGMRVYEFDLTGSGTPRLLLRRDRAHDVFYRASLDGIIYTMAYVDDKRYRIRMFTYEGALIMSKLISLRALPDGYVTQPDVSPRDELYSMEYYGTNMNVLLWE